MKVVHIEARLNKKVTLPKTFIDKLPKSVALFTTIQFMNNIDAMIKQIQDSGKECYVFKTGHTRHKGQILGCNVQDYSEYSEGKKFESFVYVGDGLFHPKALLWKNTEKKVYSYNPFDKKQSIVEKKDIERIQKLHNASLGIFYASNKIGVLVTTKPGQMMLKRAMELEKEYPEKEFFYFIDNTIDFNSLENFPFIQCWVNTACPRIGFDDSIKISKPVINLEEVKKIKPRRALIR